MISFGFRGRTYLAASIGARRKEGESYSTLAGFFRQYELYYVVADERDYELGRLDISRPFAELEKMSHVNARAHAADKDAAFSQRIREELPLP